MGQLFSDFWHWMWTTVLWWSTWNVFVVIAFVFGIYETVTGRQRRRVLGIGLVLISLTVALFHSWLSQHNEVLKTRGLLADYYGRTTQAVTISQSWVYPRDRTSFWSECQSKGRTTVCFPGIVFLLRVRNIHSFPVALDHITSATMVYDGKAVRLGYDIAVPLYFGLDPSKGIALVKHYSLRDIGMIQPYSHGDGVISFNFPDMTKMAPPGIVVGQPSRIDIDIEDSSGSVFPVHWTPGHGADINYSMMQIPSIPLGQVRKFKPPYLIFTGWGQ